VFRRDGDRLLISGDVTIDTAPDLLEAGRSEVRDGAVLVDCAGVGEVDSAAVALVLALAREARAAGRTLDFVAVPRALQQLAELYGVAEFVFRPR
jgi:phospholipid transport system transporter-binding protein